MRYIGPVLVTAIFCLAIYLLYHKLKQYSIAQIKACIEQVSSWRILLSLLSTVVSYIILIGYDWLAIKAIHKNLTLARVSLVSFVGQTVSYNFGALLGGTTVRYRFYSSWDFSVSEIVRLVLMLAVTFWVGVFGLCGIFFVFAPPHIPEELMAHMPFTDLRILGGLFFLIALAYIMSCFFIRSPIHIFGREFVFPPPHLAIAQFVVAGIDIIAAAWCMYILLPSSLGLSFADFIPNYLLAQVAAVLTHVPGGVGIFELVIINLTQTSQTQVVFAVVLLFRLIYYILPLLIAAGVFAAYEVATRKSLLRDAGKVLTTFSHSIAAYLVFACGIFFLVTSIYPISPQGLHKFHAYFPKFVSAFGMYLTSFSGVCLLFASYGLEQKERRTRNLVFLLLFLGILGALLNCFSWICVLGGAIVLLFLFFARERFGETGFFMTEKYPLHWFGGALAALLLVACATYFLYHNAFSWPTFLGNRGLNACRAMRALLGIVLFLLAFLPLQSRFWKKSTPLE